MRINNNTYNPYIGRKTSNFKPTVINGIDQLAPNAPDEVKRAWNQAETKTGINGYGMDKSGKLTHLSAMVTLQMQNRINGGSSDLLGDTKQSAIKAAKDALYLLENPLGGHSNGNNEYDKQEKTFYDAFLKALYD